MKKKWNQQLERYLQYRESLRGLVMLMDIRHPLTDPDKQMLGYGHGQYASSHPADKGGQAEAWAGPEHAAFRARRAFSSIRADQRTVVLVFETAGSR